MRFNSIPVRSRQHSGSRSSNSSSRAARNLVSSRPRKAERLQLSELAAAKVPNDMDLLGWQWHALKGSMAGRAITVTVFAGKLKMTRALISRLVNGKAGLSPELSLRLEEALGTSAESWSAMQSLRPPKKVPPENCRLPMTTILRNSAVPIEMRLSEFSQS
jgi:addiction module HigA family antidote